MKYLKITICLLFFGICAFFSTAMLIPGASSITEGGVERPKLFTENGINRSFGNEYEEYFSRAFAFRSKVVDIWSDIKLKLFSQGNDQVIIGKNGFLFFADTLDSYTGADPMTEDEINAAADSLLHLSEYAASKGASFCFIAAPNKNTIYSENMPLRYEKAETTDLDRLLAALSQRNVVFADPREALSLESSSKKLYYSTDTHWTPEGAELAFGLIAERLGLDMLDTSTLKRIDEELQGDLDTLLYPGKTLTETASVLDFSECYIYTSAFSTPMDMIITTRGSGSQKALIFRDSFFNSMLGLAASSFSETHIERANPFRIDLLEDSTYDCVIVEIAERNLRNLIGCDERITEKEAVN